MFTGENCRKLTDAFRLCTNLIDSGLRSWVYSTLSYNR